MNKQISYDNNVFLTDIEISNLVSMTLDYIINTQYPNQPLYLIGIAEKLLDSTQFMSESMKQSYREQLKELETSIYNSSHD